MKERQSAALAAAGICLSVALLRMLAPDLPFDWMTMLLVLTAAIAMLVSGMGIRPHGPGPRRHGPPPQDGAPVSLSQMEPLRAKMDRAGWSLREGGIYDALTALSGERPFAAMSAARGMLLMVMRQNPPDGEDAATMSLLIDSLDTLIAGGEAVTDPQTVTALFDWTLRALGRLEG